MELFVSFCVYLRRRRDNSTYHTSRVYQEQTKYTRLKKRPCLVRHKLLSCCYFILNQDKQRKEAAEILTLKTSVGMEQNHKLREAKLITEKSEKAD